MTDSRRRPYAAANQSGALARIDTTAPDRPAGTTRGSAACRARAHLTSPGATMQHINPSVGRVLDGLDNASGDRWLNRSGSATGMPPASPSMCTGLLLNRPPTYLPALDAACYGGDCSLAAIRHGAGYRHLGTLTPCLRTPGSHPDTAK